MNRGLVLVQSKYGAAEKYAAMLREELPCDSFALKACRGISPGQYEWIIFAAGVYAGGLAGLRAFKKFYARCSCRRLAILVVGASPHDPAAFEQFRARNFTGSLRGVPAFYGRGAWDESRMSPGDRLLCAMLRKAVAAKPDDSVEPWMRALLSCAGQACDWTDRRELSELLAFIRQGG